METSTQLLTTDLARETPKSRETVPQFKGYELFLGVPSRARVWEQMAPSVLPALRVNSGKHRVICHELVDPYPEVALQLLDKKLERVYE